MEETFDYADATKLKTITGLNCAYLQAFLDYNSCSLFICKVEIGECS